MQRLIFCETVLKRIKTFILLFFGEGERLGLCRIGCVGRMETSFLRLIGGRLCRRKARPVDIGIYEDWLARLGFPYFTLVLQVLIIMG